MSVLEDIMGKLSEVLNDPQSMRQLSQLASALTGQSGGAADDPQTENGGGHTNGQAQSGGPPPDISAMLSSLLSGTGESTAPSANTADGHAKSPPPSAQGGQPDIGKLMQIGSLISGSAANDKNIALLTALRPLLKEENQVKIDRLIKIYRLMAAYPIIRDSGLLGDGLNGLL